MGKKRYELQIEPLTGVHIGTGNELTLFDYAVKKISSSGNEKNIYLKYSSDSILDRLIQEGNKDALAEFEAASRAQDMKKLRTFFHEHLNVRFDLEYPCDITESFYRAYQKNKEKDPVENAAVVLQMYRPAGSKKPVIPGSSLKGAIRTAVLNYLLKKTGQRELLKLDNAKNDPFRALHIADAVFEAKNTQLVGQLQNIAPGRDKELTPTGMQIQAEIIRGTLIGGKAAAFTETAVDAPLQDAVVPPKDKTDTQFDFKHKLSMEEIADACNYFFMAEFDGEYEKFYSEAVESTAIITKLKSELEKASNTENCFVVRVGRWSQVEFVTFQGSLRKPRVPIRNGKSNGYGGTRTVFDYDGEYVPLGWCKCTYKEIT